MNKLEQAQAIARMAKGIARERGDTPWSRVVDPVDIDDALDDARAAFKGLSGWMDDQMMVFYRP